MAPPIASIRRFEIASPSPVPGRIRVPAFSMRLNATNRSCSRSAAMPIPLSRTSTCATSPTTLARTATSPRSVNLMALKADCGRPAPGARRRRTLRWFHRSRRASACSRLQARCRGSRTAPQRAADVDSGGRQLDLPGFDDRRSRISLTKSSNCAAELPMIVSCLCRSTMSSAVSSSSNSELKPMIAFTACGFVAHRRKKGVLRPARAFGLIERLHEVARPQPHQQFHLLETTFISAVADALVACARRNSASTLRCCVRSSTMSSKVGAASGSPVILAKLGGCKRAIRPGAGNAAGERSPAHRADPTRKFRRGAPASRPGRRDSSRRRRRVLLWAAHDCRKIRVDLQKPAGACLDSRHGDRCAVEEFAK